MKNIEIHEFSTGIIPEILPNGQWISRGFKVGEYMNLTLPKIPYSLARAIANKGFEVGKDRHSQEPTFVGRVVLSMNDKEPDYSVVAVVTSGQDEYSRSTSFYRYFLCTGKDNIWQILDWINIQKQQGINPIFNPSETKQIGKPNKHQVTKKPEINLPKNWQNWLNTTTFPVIISTKLSDLQILNKMAELKANDLPISWIYNLEAVERPEQFIIIHPANAEVAANLTKIQTKMIKNSSSNTSRYIDEAAIETAIKGLISGSKIKQEWIENLVLKLQNGQITSEYLNNLFDNLGATNGIKQGNANAQMIRLLTLRAIFIPESLPEYLNWLNISRHRKKENEKQKISRQLQLQLRNYQKLLEPLIILGANHVLSQILGKKISVTDYCCLLKKQDSLWSAHSSIIKQQVRQDLKSLENSLLHKNPGQQKDELVYGNATWKKLIDFLKNRWDKTSSSYQKTSQKTSNYYQPFADLFYQLSDYELAAYFHQISNGKVPKEIFTAAFPKLKYFYQTIIFGLTVERELDFSDHITILIRKYRRSVAATFLIMFSHGLFFILGYQVGKLNSGNIVERKTQEYPLSSEEILTDVEKNTVSELSTEKMEKALEKFSTTRREIQKIVRELEVELLNQNSTLLTTEDARLEIIKAIHEILENDVKIQYIAGYKDDVIGEEDKYLVVKKQWIGAIYSYQKKFFSDGFGYIEPNKKTADKLKCDLADLLEINLQTRPQRCG